MARELTTLNISVRRGETVAIPIRVESDQWAYATITSVAQSAPVSITATSHGIPDGWRAAIQNVKGPTALNAPNSPPRDADLRPVTVADANTVAINDVNSAGMPAYKGGGQLAYYNPIDMSLYTAARMDVRKKVGGDLQATFHTTPTEYGTLEIDTSNQCLWLRLTDDQSQALDFTRAVFDIELIRANGDVEPICSASSVLSVLPEITTSE